ncbi:MAG: tRNA (adenosine(37)-N6)-threonylcarbamoyltransferase complex ATPase subunit type 1 TsaE [Okeania sp. SIO2G4]|uniref:tRNA (adenosine(37)-N6)-threonylcarbamoyltransferase complex ATPase subunit type 1 TsaE n=1 Tax=unclassified Okeania TaxID=2634635 RepID=UPI0013B61D92|nr:MULTISPECIES: tRNA (adenosine(37)-N6)-threonylcarbamoyltransferase complex ATPase subunit type 1 TsaE [unclassified Okeania]NEP04496.1 tRNA (adenosine(37)-N6)-threonylcarbamoyltransferase complex ATPase subunit type 1 TsaE [Okeania sp. SIO4D6]NEP38954.1 tRNA (adenosine(37)-N6)-threonylcarbamoyltransferase complex ATPase subunit type 1 TsaE [Okeania sp. SIO2H7]NEP70847.1 tRNA (adenosine(37)-N6)-threonylcarbamoyltransferase complex ATPase subunit type 1 TsaE [Okeania sp. SIO2G5]NEP92374.1 tRNA
MNKEVFFSLQNTVATHNIGKSLGKILPAGSVILLEGNLGSGKTTFVQGLGAGLGIKETIDSPTFTLINEYFSGRIPLYHFDLYRLESSEIEALNLEIYWEGLEVPLGIVAIEWAEKLVYYPPNFLRVCLSFSNVGDICEQTPCARHAKLISIGKFDLDLDKI